MRTTVSLPCSRQRGFCVLAGLLGLISAGSVLAAAPAFAGPVTSAKWFTPATPANVVNTFVVGCPNASGQTATVVVTPPAGGLPIAGTVPIDAIGYASVDVGPGTPFPTSALGTYNATTTCPGYQPGTGSFTVMVPTIDLTMKSYSDVCTTPQSSFKAGEDILWCFDTTNHTGKELRYVGMRAVATTGTSFSAPGPGEHPDGVTKSYGATSQDAWGQPSYTGFVWAELGSKGSGEYAVSPIATGNATVKSPYTSLAVTTGTSAANACPAQGGTATRTVTAGETVYVCYQMTNGTVADLNPHTLTDSTLGALLTNDPTDLFDGQSRTVVSGPTTINSTTTFDASWTTSEWVDPDPNHPSDLHLPAGTTLTTGNTATVTAVAAPPTTTPPTTTPPTTAPTTTPSTTPSTVPNHGSSTTIDDTSVRGSAQVKGESVTAPIATPAPVTATPHFTG